MTNQDSILKSRAITLPTMVHLVKAMVLPVLTYEFSSSHVWMLDFDQKESPEELMLLNCGFGEDS